MVNITLAVPEELKKRMDLFPEINWSEVARQAFSQRLILFEKMNSLLKNSNLTEKDALSLGIKVNKSASKRRLKWN